MVTTETIGNKIAEARKRANLSQAQLAERLFISAQAVGKWERGESMPDITTLNRLAEIFGVDLNYFSASVQSTQGFGEALILPSRELPSEKKKNLSWDMSRGNWVDADFSGLKNLHEKFSGSNMLRCKFIGSDMAGLLLKGNNIDRCDFSRSEFSKSRIQSSNLSNNTFKDCSLKEVEFSESFINACDFSGADFTSVSIKSGGIEKSPVTNAVWKHTSFIGSYLADIVFDGTLDDCYFEDCAFTRVTFKNATLINTFFKNKSLKRIRFVDSRADRMTYEFLKNGKANLSGVTLLTT